MPSCFSAASNFLSSSRPWSFRIDVSQRLNCSSLRRSPFSRPSWMTSSSSMALTSSCGVTSAIAFFNCSSFFSDFGTDLAFAEGADLPLLELGLGDDVAVDLDQYLLDDLRRGLSGGDRDRARRHHTRGRQQPPRRRRGLAYLHFNHLNNLQHNILADRPTAAQLPQQAADPDKEAALGPRVLLRRDAGSRRA